MVYSTSGLHRSIPVETSPNGSQHPVIAQMLFFYICCHTGSYLCLLVITAAQHSLAAFGSCFVEYTGKITIYQDIQVISIDRSDSHCLRLIHFQYCYILKSSGCQWTNSVNRFVWCPEHREPPQISESCIWADLMWLCSYVNHVGRKIFRMNAHLDLLDGILAIWSPSQEAVWFCTWI